MRKFKKKFRQITRRGKWWLEYWLYEKMVVVTVPDDMGLRSLLAQGRMADALNFILSKAAGRMPKMKMLMLITQAIILKEAKPDTIDIEWRGDWKPAKRLFPYYNQWDVLK